MQTDFIYEARINSKNGKFRIETPFTSLFNIPSNESEEDFSLRCRLIKDMLTYGNANPNIVCYICEQYPFYLVGFTPLIKCVTYDRFRESQCNLKRKNDCLYLLFKYGYDKLDFKYNLTGSNHFLIDFLSNNYDQRFELWNKFMKYFRLCKDKINIRQGIESVEIYTMPNFKGKYDEEYEKDFQIFRDIIYLGGSINSSDVDHDTILMFAIGKNDGRLVKYLISKGADVKIGGMYAGPYDACLGLISWIIEECRPYMFHLLMQKDNHLCNIEHLNRCWKKEFTNEAIKSIQIEIKKGASWEGLTEEGRKYLKDLLKEVHSRRDFVAIV